jgi:hypothetical protein
MVALFLTVDILEISKFELNLNEYFTLMRFMHDMENKSFPFIPDERFFPSLLAKELIEKSDTDDSYHLTEKGIRVFKGDDLFEEFYATFPNKVPMGSGFRPVSTQDPNGISAKATRAIWDRITKGKPYLQRNIIDNLKKELASKTANGSLGYLHNIDTWLRQATWEKWDDIPDSKNSSSKSIKL